MKRPFLLLTLVFLLLGRNANAQFPMAAHLVLGGDYEGAKNYYLGVLQKDSLNFQANQELGLLLVQYFDDKGDALKYLERAIRTVKQKDMLPELYLGFAQALHYDYQFENAIPYYDKIGAYPTSAQIKNQAKLGADNCKYGLAHSRGNRRIRVANVGFGVNTLKPEFGPICDPDGTALLYTTNRDVMPGEKKDEPETRLRGDFFIANLSAGKPESGKVFYKPASPLKFLESLQDLDNVIYVSTNGQRLLILRSNQLYLAEVTDGKWGVARHLPAAINNAPAFDGNACISNDGKVIIFSAVRAGGFGGKDLYRCVSNTNGDWSEPENLGEEINSPEDEDTPTLSPDEKYLYYSSRGLDGYGGYDVFKCRISNKGTYKPVNMGMPVNSPADDIFFTLNKATSGYLSSSRKGTTGDLDIYKVLMFDSPEEQNCRNLLTTYGDDLFLDFVFHDSVFVNTEVEFDAGVSTYKGGYLMNYFWKINDTAAVADTSYFKRKFTREGKYKISLNVATFSDKDGERRDYCMSKELHVFNPKAVDTFFEPLVKANENRLVLKGTVDETKLRIDSAKLDILKIKLEPVFFNTNKFDLRKDAQETIKRNIAKMKVDAAIVVKLTAMTDPRASKDYNLSLSQKRANSVVMALEKAGIKRKRIIAVLAVGEEEASVKKCNGDETCIEKIYQFNRRVEFKIVGAEYVAPKQVPAKKGVKPKNGAPKKKSAKK